jgi:hypothetical protein
MHVQGKVHEETHEGTVHYACTLKDASTYIYGLLKLKSELLDVQGLLLTLTGQSYKFRPCVDG